MRYFIERYWPRLAINLGCFAFILMSDTGERAFIAVAFMAGLVVEPWIHLLETRDEDMQSNSRKHTASKAY